MSKLAKALTAAAGNAGGGNLYVEDVFSTYLYTGTGATLPIVNGIDLDGEGGMVWTKDRLNDSSDFYSHYLSDSERNNFADTIYTNLSGGGDTRTNYITPSSTGYSLGTFNAANTSGRSYTSFAFRKAEKFFDVVTWTGNGTAGRTIPHNLNGTVGSIWIKATNDSAPWTIWHRGLSSTATNYFYDFGTATTEQTDSSVWNSTAPTSTEITLGTSYRVNANSTNYVAYIFAHNNNDGTFGEEGEQDIIKCGVYQGLDSGSRIELGFEPQFLMIKRRDGGSTYAFGMWDIMRGFVNSGNDALLQPGRRDAELSSFSIGHPDSTGFVIDASSSDWITSSGEYCYIAIRRPMKTPESGTDVFAIDSLGGTAPNPPGFNGVLVDWAWKRVKNGLDDWYSQSRLTGTNEMKLNATDAQSSVSNILFSYQDGWLDSTATLSTQLSWMFKRATGFFDVACHTSDGVTESYPHNLGVIPELKIIKNRGDGTVNWVVGGSVLGAPTNRGYYLYLNDSSAMDTNDTFFDQNDTASVYGVRSNNSSAGGINNNSYVVYLFATLAGVSKVGSYTGDGNASQNIDCGFASGARFVLIKSTNAVGSWFVFDTTRGIVAGNDSRLELNATSAEVTSADVIDPYSAGFAVTNNSLAINVLGREYIFLAIA